MAYLFSYGSNNPSQLRKRLRHELIQPSYRAILWDHELVFAGWSTKWKSPTASLLFHPDHKVFGWCTQLEKRDFNALDQFEGAPYGSYKRCIVSIEMFNAGKWHRVKAWAYVNLAMIKQKRPSPEYLNAIRCHHTQFFQGVPIKI